MYIFLTKILLDRAQSLKYEKFKTSGCKDKKIRKILV